MADIYSLLMADDEPTAQEKSQAMQAALRRKQGVGNLALLTGDPVLGQFGAAQLQQASQTQGQLGQAGGQRSGQRLQRAMQQAGFGQQSRENQLGRDHQEKMFGLQQGAQQEQMQAAQQAELAKGADALRKEIADSDAYKTWRVAQTALGKMQSAARQPAGSKSADVAMAFGLMQVMSPQIRFQEGQIATASAAPGVPGQLLDLYNATVKGQILTPEQRQDLLSTAQGQAGVYGAALQEQAAPLLDIAQQRGIPLDQVLPNMPGAAPTRRGEPASGGGAQPAALTAPDGKTYRLNPATGRYVPE